MFRTDKISMVLGLILVAACLVPALADTRIERELDLRPGGRFVLDADSGAGDATTMLPHRPPVR